MLRRQGVQSGSLNVRYPHPGLDINRTVGLMQLLERRLIRKDAHACGYAILSLGIIFNVER